MVESAKVKKDQVLKIALAAFLHDIGKFAQRAEGNDKKPGIAAFYPSKEFIEGQQQRLQPFNKKFQNYTHKHAIYTAAFIDHLEKLLPECFQKENWGGKTWIGDLAAGHHFVKREDEDGFVSEWHNLERWVIAKADRLSSSLDREGFKNFETEYNKNQEIANFKSARLWPIIEAIKTQKASTKESYNGGFKYRIPLNDLKDDLFFAKPADEVLPESKQNAVNEYQELFFRFIEELKGLEQFKHNVDLWFDQFENLYMRYAGQIPAATVSPAMQDISLYDHSKITAAIAVSLYLYHKETGQDQISDIENDKLNKLQFVGASFNGIQKFIFASGGSTNKAAAKILRGRSFYVSLLSETVGEMLMEETGLPPTSIVFNAAGQITLIAPNLQRIKEAVQRVRERTNDWLIKAYYGQTSVGFAQIETSQESIAMEYRQMWQNLSRAMEKEKFKKFDLSKYGGIQTQFFKNFNPELGICSFCGQRPAQNLIHENETENYICNICQDQLEIGAKLVKSDAIAIWNKDEDVFNKNLKEPLFNKFQVWLGKLGEAIKMGKQGKLLKLARLSNSTSEPEWRKVAFKPIKGYVPIYNEEDEYLDNENPNDQVKAGNLKSFEAIAATAQKEMIPGEGKSGIAALGVLKADVDNLGMIFGLGLNEDIQTLTRISVLSRQFNNFFAIYLPSLLQQKFRNTYTVFAGGDDLFLIGAWDEIIEAAPYIREKFGEFVCHNPDISLSMGISFHKPGEPVTTMATASEEALEKAKSAEGKDSICIFEEVVKWEELKRLNRIATDLRNWIYRKSLNTAMLYRFNFAIKDIQTIKTLWNEQKKGKKVNFELFANSLSWKARLKYSLIRNFSNGEDKIMAGDMEAQQAELTKVIEWLEKHGTNMKIPLWQEIYRRRKN